MYNPLPLLTTGLLQDELAKANAWFSANLSQGNDAWPKGYIPAPGLPPGRKSTADQHLGCLEKTAMPFL